MNLIMQKQFSYDYRCGGDEVVPGTFRGGDEVVPGTFRGGDEVVPGTFR